MEFGHCVFLVCTFAFHLNFVISFPVVKPQGKVASELPQNFDPSLLNMDIVAEWLKKLQYNQESADSSSTEKSGVSNREESTERKDSNQDSAARNRRHQEKNNGERENERKEPGNQRVDGKAKKRMNKLEKLFRRSYRKEEPGGCSFTYS